MSNADPTADQSLAVQEDETLPLPGWLKTLYFLFPIVLYLPDAIFNYYVYSDGVNVPRGNWLAVIAATGLWGFLSVGVVGMAYLLSVLAPWHWGRGHRVQAFFCGVGVLIATIITIWNSLAYRSQSFQSFVTDQWAYQLWPQLQTIHFSVTMVLVAVAPPFWGLFWAIVQPTERRHSTDDLKYSQQTKLLRIQHEADLKAAKAQANAKVREAQLRGMAATANAAREQAAQVIKQASAANAANNAASSASASVATSVASEDSAPRAAAAGSRQVSPDALLPWRAPVEPESHLALRDARWTREVAPTTSAPEPSFRIGDRPDMSHLTTPEDQFHQMLAARAQRDAQPVAFDPTAPLVVRGADEPVSGAML